MTDPAPIAEPPAWFGHARCAGATADMFAVRVEDQHAAVERYCTGCPVRAECVAHGAATQVMTTPHGCWGCTERDLTRVIGLHRDTGRPPVEILAEIYAHRARTDRSPRASGAARVQADAIARTIAARVGLAS